MARNEKSNKQYKRLVVLSDGTWQTLENKEPTNILKLTKAIKREDDEGVQQVIFYDSGVGTQGTVDKYVGGAFGVGIEQNIKELYTFLALNYDDGDEVYLFGFSRGSYTVRSLVGLIYESGLCRREEIHAVNGAYELYRKNEDVESEDAQDFRKLHGDRIPIKLLVCFDTVASLGVPLGKKFFGNFNKNHFGFHTTTLNDSVENAIHMLSIDEDRSAFKPTLMAPSDGAKEGQLTQLFFWGGHGGIGGGDENQIESAKCTLKFCVEEMKRRKIPLALNDSGICEDGDILAEGGPSQSKKVAMKLVEFATDKFVRKVDSVDMLHKSAIKRYKQCKSWRPDALADIREDILKVKLSDDEEQVTKEAEESEEAEEAEEVEGEQ